ncbi:unnamed protein product [Vitrella brassicaformis CCMP3155]|uniref:Uncharacterized protein n=1 Tax=Vitrella brassicaformis (strain CCMP3155) TaxID=1169540 RepID=A0A0G4G9S1_VITBC|nr:unnamed protein product [Vitrella brassicaformis CCMP3155]|eukprot:CEM25767.1 unnamed protein product [Vitrella brassicaformis CCMP3155]
MPPPQHLIADLDHKQVRSFSVAVRLSPNFPQELEGTGVPAVLLVEPHDPSAPIYIAEGFDYLSFLRQRRNQNDLHPNLSDNDIESMRGDSPHLTTYAFFAGKDLDAVSGSSRTRLVQPATARLWVKGRDCTTVAEERSYLFLHCGLDSPGEVMVAKYCGLCRGTAVQFEPVDHKMTCPLRTVWGGLMDAAAAGAVPFIPMVGVGGLTNGLQEPKQQQQQEASQQLANGQRPGLMVPLPRSLAPPMTRINDSFSAAPTPLFLLARDGGPITAEQLKDLGAQQMTIACTDLEWTPLQMASHMGHIDVVQALLSHPLAPALINKAIDHQTPLVLAATANHDDVVQCLLEAGADPTTRTEDQRGDTLVHLCARKGCTEALWKLGDFDRSLLSLPNRCGETPLSAAVKADESGAVTCLLDMGVDFKMVTSHLPTQPDHKRRQAIPQGGAVVPWAAEGSIGSATAAGREGSCDSGGAEAEGVMARVKKEEEELGIGALAQPLVPMPLATEALPQSPLESPQGGPFDVFRGTGARYSFGFLLDRYPAHRSSLPFVKLLSFFLENRTYNNRNEARYDFLRITRGDLNCVNLKNAIAKMVVDGQPADYFVTCDPGKGYRGGGDSARERRDKIPEEIQHVRFNTSYVVIDRNTGGELRRCKSRKSSKDTLTSVDNFLASLYREQDAGYRPRAAVLVIKSIQAQAQRNYRTADLSWRKDSGIQDLCVAFGEDITHEFADVISQLESAPADQPPAAADVSETAAAPAAAAAAAAAAMPSQAASARENSASMTLAPCIKGNPPPDLLVARLLLFQDASPWSNTDPYKVVRRVVSLGGPEEDCAAHMKVELAEQQLTSPSFTIEGFIYDDFIKRQAAEGRLLNWSSDAAVTGSADGVVVVFFVGFTLDPTAHPKSAQLVSQGRFRVWKSPGQQEGRGRQRGTSTDMVGDRPFLYCGMDANREVVLYRICPQCQQFVRGLHHRIRHWPTCPAYEAHPDESDQEHPAMAGPLLPPDAPLPLPAPVSERRPLSYPPGIQRARGRKKVVKEEVNSDVTPPHETGAADEECPAVDIDLQQRQQPDRVAPKRRAKRAASKAAAAAAAAADDTLDDGDDDQHQPDAGQTDIEPAKKRKTPKKTAAASRTQDKEDEPRQARGKRKPTDTPTASQRKRKAAKKQPMESASVFGISLAELLKDGGHGALLTGSDIPTEYGGGSADLQPDALLSLEIAQQQQGGGEGEVPQQSMATVYRIEGFCLPDDEGGKQRPATQQQQASSAGSGPLLSFAFHLGTSRIDSNGANAAMAMAAGQPTARVWRLEGEGGQPAVDSYPFDSDAVNVVVVDLCTHCGAYGQRSDSRGDGIEHNEACPVPAMQEVSSSAGVGVASRVKGGRPKKTASGLSNTKSKRGSSRSAAGGGGGGGGVGGAAGGGACEHIADL